MSYIVYKTTHLPTGRFYIGQHKEKFNEDYLGSGVRLKHLMKKYPREEFVRETLFSFATLNESRQKEIEIVTTDLLSNPLCLNLSIGGKGYTPGQKFTDAHKKKIGESHRLSYAQKMGFEDVEELTRFVLYALNDGLTPNKIRLETGISGRVFGDILKIVDANFLKENFRKSFVGKSKSEDHKKNISKGRSGIVFSDDHKQKLRAFHHKNSEEFRRRAKETYWKTRGYNSSAEVTERINILFQSGYNISQISIQMDIDPMTIKKRIQNDHSKPDRF